MIDPRESPVWHPFTQHALEHPMREIADAEGAWLTAKDGLKIFDAISSWWVVTHGHRHPTIMAAIRAQTEKLDQVIFAGLTHEPAERVANELLTYAPDGLAHVFFSDSGSTSVEVALKMALGYWRNVGERRTRILALEHAYHGDTIGTMSTGARGVFNAAYEPLLFEVGRIPFPLEGREQRTLDALETECRKGGVAALIVEPLILGAGGMLIYEASTLVEMHRICRAHGVLLIADEVMTGFGRTGARFACDVAQIEPDILCLAKGLTGGTLPLAATLCRREIFLAHYSTDRSKTFFHSSSYTANPICCAAAAANFEVWREESVDDRISALTSNHAPHLVRLADTGLFENVRQIGTIAALDLAGQNSGYLADVALVLRRRFLEKGVLLRPLGATIYVMPPYCATEDELARVYDVIEDVAKEVHA